MGFLVCFRGCGLCKCQRHSFPLLRWIFRCYPFNSVSLLTAAEFGALFTLTLTSCRIDLKSHLKPFVSLSISSSPKRGSKWLASLVARPYSREGKTFANYERALNSFNTNNLLLTEREGRTGEYWPEVVTVRTERSEVRTKTTEGQYSLVRPEQARLVSSLLYGTLFLIAKCTSVGLHLKNVRLLHPSLKFWKKFDLLSFCW